MKLICHWIVVAFASTIAPLSQAFAQGVTLVGENAEASYYVDKSSIKKSGQSVEFWEIIDYKQLRRNRKGEAYGSMQIHVRVECQQYRQINSYMKVYSDHMGGGKLLASGSTNDRWEISRGSTLEVVRDFVCR